MMHGLTKLKNRGRCSQFLTRQNSNTTNRVSV